MWHDIRGIYQLCREKYSDELGQVKTPEQAKLYEFELTAGFKAMFSHTCRVWLCNSKLPNIEAREIQMIYVVSPHTVIKHR